MRIVTVCIRHRSEYLVLHATQQEPGLLVHVELRACAHACVSGQFSNMLVLETQFICSAKGELLFLVNGFSRR
jgi:hypothetical protein